ncbi:MAG: nucleotidyltransferase domain-containing protein [Chloroflexi bacterium]|nr:MAG: nucleotidyltransferase domain-containing protein [Chloroflexota bacterium]
MIDTRNREQQRPFDEEGLVAFLRSQPDIVAAYLFGSQATGRVHPGSDVDIAVLLDEDALPQTTGWGGPLLSRRLDLIAAAERFADCEVDVITLNNASPLLSFEVLRKGRLLYEGNRRERVEFEVQTGKNYADLLPMYDFFNKDLVTKIRKVGLSGRRHPIRKAADAGRLSKRANSISD